MRSFEAGGAEFSQLEFVGLQTIRMLLGFRPLPPAPLSRQAGEAPRRPSRWFPRSIGRRTSRVTPLPNLRLGAAPKRRALGRRWSWLGAARDEDRSRSPRRKTHGRTMPCVVSVAALREDEQKLSYLMSYRSSFILSHVSYIFCCYWASAPCRRPLSVRRNCHCLGVACFWASASCRRPLSVRHNCHWLPCSCEKRVRYIVYRVFDLGLRPLPPAPLSKFLGFRPLPPVSF